MIDQNLNLDNTEAIIFDLGGVILNLDYNRTINEFKRLGGSQFDHLYSKANQDQIFDAFEVGSINASYFIKYMAKLLPSEIKDQEIIDAWNAMLLDLPVQRLELLKNLSKRYKLYLFSNTNEIHFNAFSKYFNEQYGENQLLENYFIQTYYSHKVKCRKPNSEAFNLVINDNNLSAEKVLFIDDSIQHIEGAQLLGINTFHLQDTDIVTLFNL